MSSATTISNSIPYADMNASYFRNFDIDWFKFDGAAYTWKQSMSYNIIKTLENIPMPDVNFQSPSTTDHFEFAL